MKNNKEVQIALKKASSLIVKIQKMNEDSAYCIDTIQQVLAAIGLLRGVNEKILDGHLRSCFRTAMTSGSVKQQDEMTDELSRVLRMAARK